MHCIDKNTKNGLIWKDVVFGLLALLKVPVEKEISSTISVQAPFRKASFSSQLEMVPTVVNPRCLRIPRFYKPDKNQRWNSKVLKITSFTWKCLYQKMIQSLTYVLDPIIFG